MKVVNNHVFFDGYNLEESILKDQDRLNKLLETINNKYFNNEGDITLLPYFNGKVREDGGISGILLGRGFHFTIHTFCYKNTVFIDCYGLDGKNDEVVETIKEFYKTDDYDLGLSDIEGKFGKHIIFKPDVLSCDEAIEMIKKILKEIEMTPICDTIVRKYDDNNYDLIQPIAESHISFHRKDDVLVVDAFSCKYFDVDKLKGLFKNPKEHIEVNRGIRYK